VGHVEEDNNLNWNVSMNGVLSPANKNPELVVVEGM
jgi:hypothetical protein